MAKHQKQENIVPYQILKQNIKSYQPRCHRDLDLQVWLDKQKTILVFVHQVIMMTCINIKINVLV